MNDESTAGPRPEKSGHDEWKVLAVLLLLLVGLEGMFRGLESRFSADVRHLRALPDRVKQIGARDSEEETTLIVGNSLARRAVDAAALKAGLEKKSGVTGAVHIEFFVPDASSVTEWSWGLRRYFGREKVNLERIIVITGRSHLLDFPGNPEKLGAYFVAREDLPDAMAITGGEEEAIGLLLGNVSALAANRERVRPLVGYRFLPGFEKAWHELVAAGFLASLDRLGDSAGLWELRSLDRLLNQAAEFETELLVVAAPLPEAYRLPEKAVQLLEQKKARVIDLSAVPEIEEEDFPDGYHLSAEGAAKFTEALLRALP